MTARDTLETTCKQFIDSLLGNATRHVLCLNIAEPGFAAEQLAADYLRSKGHDVTQIAEPTPHAFGDLLAHISGKTCVVAFDDLDKHAKCIDLLVEHAPKPHPGGRLVVVSRNWNSHNTPKERELRKSCLFYEQARAHEPK